MPSTPPPRLRSPRSWRRKHRTRGRARRRISCSPTRSRTGSSIPGAAIAEQRFEGSFRGDEVELRNLIATLPGESERQIAVLAPRDAADGSGALTSIASTAALLEIANGFSGSVHNKTLVFVSTDGSSIGALGARRFVRDYSDADRLDAAIVLSQPAAPQPRPPW